MKSAREIALEKVARLGKPSPQELQQIREREFVPVGEALAARYLAGEYEWRDVVSRLSKIGEARDVVAWAMLGKLIASLALGDNVRAFAGSAFLAPDQGRVRDIERKLNALVESYNVRKQEKTDFLRGEMEQSLKQEMADAGIAGTAIRVAAERHPHWQEALELLEAEFGKELNNAKGELLNSTAAPTEAAGKEKT